MMNISLTETLTLIAFVLYTILLVGLGATLVVTRRRVRSFAIDSIKANADVQIIADELDRVILETSDEANDSFIKFLSDSREWAFSYIEDVQTVLLSYRNALDGKDAEVIIEARKRLFELLPESSEKND